MPYVITGIWSLKKITQMNEYNKIELDLWKKLVIISG